MGINLTNPGEIRLAQYRGRGRYPKRPEITPQRARQEAASLLNRLPPTARIVIDLLSTAGVMTSGQLARSASTTTRTLRRYYQQYLLDRLPIVYTDQIARTLSEEHCVLYSLGPVGLEIARLTNRPAPSYAGFGVVKVAHDVYTAETVLRLADSARGSGWKTIWHSKYEATVPDAHGRPALEPDALVVFLRGEETRFALLEFHNEDSGTRTADKIRRYEAIYLEGRWREVWGTEEFPVLLVVFTHKAVGVGYTNAIKIKGNRVPRIRILLRPFQEILSGEPLEGWFDPVGKKKVHLLEEEGE